MIIAPIPLQLLLHDQNYDPATSSKYACLASNAIKTRMRALQSKRYKIVCQVMIVPPSQQQLVMTSRCLWDAENDNFASVTYTNDELFAVATTYVTYCE